MHGKKLILPALLCCLFCGGCETLQALGFQRPTARVAGIQFGQVTLSDAQLLFDIEVDNPYPAALPLTNLDYKLSSGAQPFLTGQADLQGSIPANSKKLVSLPVSVNYLELFRSLKNIQPGMTIPYQAGLGLSVDTPGLGPLTLPLKKEGQLSLPSISGTDIMTIRDLLLSK